MSNYSDYKTMEKVVNSYRGDDIPDTWYPVFTSNDNQIKVYRVKDVKNNITFHIRVRGFTILHVTRIVIDQDDEIDFLGKGIGLIAYIEKKDW